MGSTRQNAFNNADIGPPHRASPVMRQPLGSNNNLQSMNFGLTNGSAKRAGIGGLGNLGR